MNCDHDDFEWKELWVVRSTTSKGKKEMRNVMAVILKRKKIWAVEVLYQKEEIVMIIIIYI